MCRNCYAVSDIWGSASACLEEGREFTQFRRTLPDNARFCKLRTRLYWTCIVARMKYTRMNKGFTPRQSARALNSLEEQEAAMHLCLSSIHGCTPFRMCFSSGWPLTDSNIFCDLGYLWQFRTRVWFLAELLSMQNTYHQSENALLTQPCLCNGYHFFHTRFDMLDNIYDLFILFLGVCLLQQ